MKRTDIPVDKQKLAQSLEKLMYQRIQSSKFNLVMLFMITLFDFGMIMQGHKYAVFFLGFMILNCMIFRSTINIILRLEFDAYLMHLYGIGQMKSYTR